jgi:hypothetical protein
MTLPPPVTAPSSADYGKAVDSLSLILERYPGWDDILSKKLFTWGIDTCKMAIKNGAKGLTIIAAIAQERFDELSKILVNPLDGSPLQEPVLEREWTWEAWQHAECRRLFSSVSPLDGEPMSPNPPSHLFVKEMIDWLHQQTTSSALILRPASSSDLSPVELVVLSNDPISLKLRRWNYQVRAKVAVQKPVDEEMDKVTQRLDQGAIQLREGNQQAREEALVQRTARDAALQQQFDSVVRTCQQTLDAKDAATAAMQAFYEASHAEEVRHNLENAAAVQTLGKRFADMQQQSQLDRAASIQQNEATNQRWTKAFSELEDQTRSTTRISQEAVTSLTGTVTGLQTQVVEQQKELHQAQGQLHQANAQNAQNVQVMQNQCGTIAQMQQEICRLRNADDGWCVIS